MTIPTTRKVSGLRYALVLRARLDDQRMIAHNERSFIRSIDEGRHRAVWSRPARNHAENAFLRAVHRIRDLRRELRGLPFPHDFYDQLRYGRMLRDMDPDLTVRSSDCVNLRFVCMTEDGTRHMETYGVKNVLPHQVYRMLGETTAKLRPTRWIVEIHGDTRRNLGGGAWENKLSFLLYRDEQQDWNRPEDIVVVDGGKVRVPVRPQCVFWVPDGSRIEGPQYETMEIG